ncbi:glycosyltransferase family 9 protein [Bradyrhizobium sp. STM 3557]|uniref:glycosyltransferase family 9 protein n=1 Tax=Bradyrhizobium sp. STM 3557 TaxID=578920 RepID=UPI00389111DD
MTAPLIDVDTLHSPARRVAILNGFGRTLGDGIIGLQALHLAMRLGIVPSRPTLFRLAGFGPMVEAVHAAADIAEIRILPPAHARPQTRFDAANEFDQVIDVREFAFAADFQRTSMIDFFLRRLGVDPQLLPSAFKRNTWLAPRVTPQPAARARGHVQGYVLVCPRASMRIRDMPDEIHDAILRQLAGRCAVVTQGHVPDGLADEVAHAPECKALAELCALVRGARWVISTDTAMVHLADAFGVPCLAFFPTHRPEWRVRDYPRCVAVPLRSALPPGLEFARGVGDLALARRAWFPNGADLDWLKRVIDRCRAWHEPRSLPSEMVT